MLLESHDLLRGFRRNLQSGTVKKAKTRWFGPVFNHEERLGVRHRPAVLPGPAELHQTRGLQTFDRRPTAARLSARAACRKFRIQQRKQEMTMETGRERLIIPALGPFYEATSPYAYALMRFATGAVLVPHGVQKVFFLSIDRYSQIIGAKGLPFSELLAYLTFFTEFVAAACLAIGLFTRVAAAMIAIEMIVIIFVFQWPNGYFWTNRGYEYALLWALLSIAIVFRGGGRFSLDRLIGKEF